MPYYIYCKVHMDRAADQRGVDILNCFLDAVLPKYVGSKRFTK
ncbi:hypothetical protein [Mycobacterium cookii]|nr:hypothetical protein [Mycobacterium cookii]